MTQNLLINNDKDDEIVKFTVELPDGYTAFRVESIDGTLINQNYLKIGDKIKLTFNNNPIIYDTQGKYHYVIKHKYINGEEEEIQEKTVDKLRLDLFQIYETLYVPIYSLIDAENNMIYYLFNPRDDSQLMKEPKETLDDYLGMSFTGEYVITLRYIPNIPDIDVTFGESIQNSKTSFEDIGAINAVGESVADNFQAQTYTYGSSWRYNVKNLILNHRINYELIQNNAGKINLILSYFLKLDDEEYSVNIDNFLSQPFTQTMNFNDNEFNIYSYTFSSPPDTHTYTLINNTYYSAQNLRQNNEIYIYDDGTIPTHPHMLMSYELAALNMDGAPNHPLLDETGFKSTGQKIMNTSLNHTITGLKTNVFYTCRSIRIQIKYKTNAGTFKPILFNTWWFTEGAVVEDNCIKVLINNTGDVGKSYGIYYITSNNNPKRASVWFTSEDLPNETVLYLDQRCKGDQTHSTRFQAEGGQFTVIYSIYKGRTNTQVEYSAPSIDIFNKPLQFTHLNDFDNGDDDLLISDDSTYFPNTAEFSMPNLTNDKITCELVDNSDTSKFTYTRSTPVTLPKNLFVPMKSRQELKLHENGCCIICDNNNPGSPSQILDDALICVYLATGHETLNVEPASDDDMFYKTFNGSLIFDRSKSRITRLFANSQSNSCLGYINDIIAAKLSRYYFVSDWQIFDTFIDTKESLNISRNPKQSENFNIRYKDKYFTGEHNVILSNCFDLVKFIGSDTIVNNCQPTITPEEQTIYVDMITAETMTETRIQQAEYANHVIKCFHYYNSGFNSFPQFGLLYENSTVPEGLTINSISSDRRNTNAITLIVDKDKANRILDAATISTFKQTEYQKNLIYPRDETGYGLSFIAPIGRIYRNANYEQSDLTISTGRMKTLNPVYVQCVNRCTVNNLLYMFDVLLSYNIADFNKNFIVGVNYQMMRFTTLNDFTNLMILNFMNRKSVNEYDDIKALNESLPTAGNTQNEELIYDISTVGMNTNVQLFSDRLFDFHEQVSYLSVVDYSQILIESSDLPTNTLSLYFGSNNAEQIKTYIDNFYKNYNISNRFNIRRNIKCFVCKLGEFLEYPKIIFGVVECFNNSNSVLCVWTNPSQYYSTFTFDPSTGVETFTPNDKQKRNVSLFGVMFRYHQLSLGWQRMESDIQEVYDISKAKGQKHFTLTLIDEFGRMFPNIDTSQGFNNNLKLEVTMFQAERH